MKLTTRAVVRTFAVAATLGLALAAPADVRAQQLSGRCATPDSIAVRGVVRTSEASVRTEGGLVVGTPPDFPSIGKGVHAIYALGQYEDVSLDCDLEAVPDKAILVWRVKERALLGDIQVVGVKALSPRAVRDRVDLLIGRPLDPAQIAHAKARIDSLYESSGYYLARVKADSTIMPDGRIALTYRVDEGRRLAVSGVDIVGNKVVKEGTIVGAMQTKPEGFWWFRKGEYDDNKYVADLGEKIPQLYSRLGYSDMRISHDTMIVDRERGKALVQINIEEGPRYRVGSFEISGNRAMSTEDVRRLYPFEGDGPGLTTRMKGLLKREHNAPEGVFNQAKWDEAVDKLNVELRNRGYLYARVNPVAERGVGPDSQPVMNLRWEIDEKNPAIINRVEIVGNDYTTEDCIRRQIYLPPGGVFNQDLLVRSWQSIRNMGFFEQDMAFPDPRPANDNGDVDIVFRVKEKRTGAINFGASMGQGGVGFGGFIGVEQPNLFGLCKTGKLNWQYGRYFNDFTATYADPALFGSRNSGALSAYRTQSKYIVGNLGQNIRTGASLRFGLPTPWSDRSSIASTYSAEATTFTSGTLAGQCSKNCFRSNIGLEYNYDTRVNMPFATQGTLRSLTADFSGGPLGGTVTFQRFTGEVRAYAPLALIGSNPATAAALTLGLKANAGVLFGNTGPFFLQQQFAVGGVMYGQALRGYPEFSITPKGFNQNTGQYTSDPASFGNAFLTVSGEIGLRLNSAVYANVFTDVGNNWASAREFNPTRLFRSAGLGVTTQTPLGILGLDVAYGFDRTVFDVVANRVRPDPRWQFHFRLGQIF